ncbi:MAG: hypothetical protein IH969_10110, partial [Candidatus Krumholzibacteriota bacterium]|nr:hypothetical protein [Candidatus Krumholzibacteriota bacterium]
RDVGQWFAQVERMGIGAQPVTQALGRIDVLVPDGNGGWEKIAEVGEHGPLAADTYVVPLPPGFDGSVRLRLTKGNWRIDYVALAELGQRVTPRRIEPAEVRRDGRLDPAALAALLDSSRVLTTMPGTTYSLSYSMLAGAEGYELFLESTGYYLEWIREEWLADTDPMRATEMIFSTDVALRRLAPQYKGVESGMEEAFWGSRFAKP